jgi:hypothetical protein
MAGSPIRRARREAAAYAGHTPGTAEVYADGMVYTGKIVDGDGNPVDPDEYRERHYPHTDDSASAGAHARARTSLDFRQQTIDIADDCARRLRERRCPECSRSIPDRDTAQVYRSMIEILTRIEARDPKDPTPRPEDVRKGVIDMLTMLPDLCANDTELRTLAVDALARVLDQGE